MSIGVLSSTLFGDMFGTAAMRGVFGELAFLSPDNRRTQSLECTEDGEVLAITYDRLLEIYFQNPEFGYYFLRLSTERLLQNIARLEGIIDEYKAKEQAAAAYDGDLMLAEEGMTVEIGS